MDMVLERRATSAEQALRSQLAPCGIAAGCARSFKCHDSWKNTIFQRVIDQVSGAQGGAPGG